MHTQSSPRLTLAHYLLVSPSIISHVQEISHLLNSSGFQSAWGNKVKPVTFNPFTLFHWNKYVHTFPFNWMVQ